MKLESKINFLLLGLLSHEPMTGYDIKKRIDTTLRLFWNAGYGSIYPALSWLEAAGYICRCDVPESGREKIMYSITASGRSALREWLQDPVTKDELRYETLLKLFFGCEAGPATAVAHIDAFEQKIKAQLPALKASVAHLQASASEPAHKYYMLTALFGAKIYEAYLEWCTEAKELLEEDVDV